MKIVKKMMIFIVFGLLSISIVSCGTIQDVSTIYGLNTQYFDTSNIDTEEELTIYTINHVMSATVEIEVSNTFTYTQATGGGPWKQSKTVTESATSQATGFFINEEGYILTNAHVILLEDYESLNNFKYVDRTIYINYAESSQKFEATVIDYDQDLDLAVLKIDENEISNIKYLTLYDMTDPISATYQTTDAVKLLYGQTAIVVGNANGYGISVTKGIVSAPLRYFSNNGSTTQSVQIDAAVNSGNSGGPVVNLYGAVIGIVTFKIITDTSESLGYAIPSNVVKAYVNDLSHDIKLYTTNIYDYSYLN